MKELEVLKGPKIMKNYFDEDMKKGMDPKGGKPYEEWEGYLTNMGAFSKKPAYSFSGKRDTTSKRGEYKTPGPGAYDPDFYDPDDDERIDGRAAIIGTSVRPQLAHKNSRNQPGPGQYNHQGIKYGYPHKFGKQKKIKEIDLDDPDILPGAGTFRSVLIFAKNFNLIFF